MKQFFVGVLATIGVLFGANHADAASLGLTTSAPTIESDTAFVDFFDFGFGDGDLSTFSAEVDFTDGVTLTDPAFIDFGIGFSLADPKDAPGGGFSVFDDFGFNLVLSGDLIDIGYTDDTVELLFDTLTGSAAAEFGSKALMTISFFDPFDELGANPFDDFVDGFFYDANVSISKVVVGVVPVPAGLPLVLTGLAGLAFLRRKRLS